MNQKIGIVLIVLTSLAGLTYYVLNNSMMENNPEEVRDHSDQLNDFEIGPGEVVLAVQNGKPVTILDLRTPADYEKMHIQNALLLPAQELSKKTLSEIGVGTDKKDALIVLYDKSGSASKTAYKMMTALGYTNVKSVSGGITHWQEDEFPMLESGTYTGPTIRQSNQEDIESTDGPKITLSDDWYDFGEITQYGGVVEKTFTITNTGTDTLEIGDLTTSCSCASADISSNRIEPGEDAILTVYFDPDFHAEPEGVFTRTVFIPTNDPNTPEAEVTIQVDILEGE